MKVNLSHRENADGSHSHFRGFEETTLMEETMNTSVTRTIRNRNSLTILQRIAAKDKTAVADCVDVYGNFIWALARKLTASREEAETAAQEIFTDIWRYAERADKVPSAESLLIALIARQRLIKYLH